MHYISTTSTVGAVDGDGLGREDARTPAGKVPASGYVASKWVAEQLVWQAGERGVPVTVFRPGLISGDIRVAAASTDDAFWNTVKAAAVLGCAPDVGEASVTLVPVTYVARAIAAISSDRDSAGRAYHLVNRVAVPVSAVLGGLRRAGIRVDTIPLEHFQQLIAVRAQQRDPDDSVVRAAMLYQQYGSGARTEIVWDDTNARRALAEAGIRCPRIDDTAIDRYIEYFMTLGFLPQPGRDASK